MLMNVWEQWRNRRHSSLWYLENWIGFRFREPVAFRKFGTTLALLSLYLSLLILNDKCPALKIVDRCLCEQRVAGLKSGLQVPSTLTFGLFTQQKTHLHTASGVWQWVMSSRLAAHLCREQSASAGIWAWMRHWGKDRGRRGREREAREEERWSALIWQTGAKEKTTVTLGLLSVGMKMMW